MRIHGPHDVSKWLRARSVDTSTWGTGAAKTVDDLWHEIRRGECSLADAPARRVLRGVARLVIRRDGQQLIEREQVMRDGRTRERGRSPAEKMQRGETYLDAVARCLEEELGIPRSAAQVLEHTVEDSHVRQESPSYPGLLSEYLCHQVEVRVDSLPEGEFWTDESQAGEGDPVRRHRWEWLG